MSVDREYRRRGIATGILDHLIQLARSSGVTSLILETNEPWVGVVRFYLEYGFQITAQGNGNVHRNLLYTGVTRGKKLVVLVGTKKALAIAVKNDKTEKRYTRLRDRLMV